MESFLVAVNAVIPFFCYLALGYTMKIRGVVKEEFLQKLNQMVFRVFYPFMTFYNIYKADAESLPRPLLLIFTGASILIVEAILIVIIPKIVKENPRRGVIIQAIFRSNFVLFGLPLTIEVFGDSAASIAAMMVTVVVSIYNTTSVFILEMFNGEGKSDIKKTLKRWQRIHSCGCRRRSDLLFPWDQAAGKPCDTDFRLLQYDFSVSDLCARRNLTV